MKHEGLTSGAAELGVELSGDQVRTLGAFEELLADRAVELGMIAAGDLPRLRERHVLDCLRAVAVVAGDDRAAADLGSGAGLPGIVVAIACPGLAVTLVEARRARAAFLELAVERLGLSNVVVEHARAEAVSGSFDLCFARAFADPPSSWRVAEPLLGPAGRLVYFAGASFDPREDVPEEVVVTILRAPPVASAGPLAIMTRQ
ncbi:MAG TPA: 16S rRNA (guanine(527)-N(7))-methyltransferase RsmG [Actinomycetota bacterium]|nr:16S rRNA (guanine(527)-N(7))-methyltransferase RsmG [Actinomycetota bacterium]